MPDRPVEQLTLREMFIDAERLSRELIEHLDRGFIPKTHELARLVRPINGEPPDLDVLEDVTVRNHTARVLDSGNFTEDVVEQLTKYCNAIDESVSRILTDG